MADRMLCLGSRLLMGAQQLALGPLETEAARVQREGRALVYVAQSGRVVGLIVDAVQPAVPR